jgi:hypothetical protein
VLAVLGEQPQRPLARLTGADALLLDRDHRHDAARRPREERLVDGAEVGAGHRRVHAREPELARQGADDALRHAL